MSKAKRNALAVLFAAVALFMFAALLCLGFPIEEAKAESGEAAYGASVNTFTAEMPEGYLANNVSDAAAADGSSAEETVVANITRGGQTLEFFTVQAAIGAAQDGETIKIPASSVITENIEVGSDQNIEISINADVQFSGDFLNEGTIAIEISGGALGKKIPSEFNAEITNSGSLSIEIKRYSSAGAYYYAELNGPVSNSGTLTLTGTGNCNAQITNATGGVLTVKNNLNVNGDITNSGTFTIANGTYNGNIVNNGGTIAIQGGNFTQEQKEAFGDYLAEGYRWTLSSTAGNFSAIAEESVVYTLTRGDGYGFASLSAALTAANEGETIVLEKPYSIKTPNFTQKLNKSVTVDLNGKKISTQSRFEATTAGTDITVKNGSIVYTGNGSNATYVGFRVSGGASLTLDGVSVDWSSIDSGRAAEVGVSNTSAAGTLILKNGSVLKGGEVGVFLAGTKDADTENKTALYAEDSIIESVAAASAGVMTNGSTYNTVIELVNTDVSGTLAIYQPSKNSTLTIDGGTMRGNTGIEIRNGTLTVKGGAEIVATGEYKVSETPSSSGSTVSGAALAVTKYENDGTLTVNIAGGTFRAESENGVAFCERNPEADDGTHSPENVPSVSITGGIFEGSVSAVNVQKFIEGGTFSEALPAEYLAAECAQMSADGTFTVGTTESLVAEKKAVAMNAETAVAYTSLQDAVKEASIGDEVMLLDDITVTETITLSLPRNLTINLNGHTITGGDIDKIFYVRPMNVTFKNGKIVAEKLAFEIGGGSGPTPMTVTFASDLDIVSNNDSAVLISGTIKLNTAADITARGAAIMGNGAASGFTGINVTGGNLTSTHSVAMYLPQKSGTTTISGGTITGMSGIEIRNGTLNIKGGTIIATGETLVTKPNGNGSTVNAGAAVAVSKYTGTSALKVNVSGGELKGLYAFYEANLNPDDAAIDASKITVALTDGTINGALSSDNLTEFVSGGTFSEAVPAEYLAAECAQMSADGTFTVGTTESLVAEKKAVAVNAETAVAYTSLQEAVNAADAGETVTLLANVNESIEIAQGQEIVLDLNGKTLTNAAGSHTVTNYGTLTIVGNGTVTNTTDEKAAVFNEGTAYLNGGTYTRTADGTWYVIANNGAMEMRGITVRNENVNDPSSLVQNNLDASKDDPATLTIYSGNYACAGGNVIMNNDYGVLTIEDGTFVAHNYTDKENYQVVQNYATATINGGTFTADAVAIAASAYDGQSSSTTINGGTFTAGSHGSAAALYFFDYDGNSSVNVTITGGEFNGTYAIRTYKDSTADDTMSIQGGTFEGDIAMGDMTGFIEGGMFKQQPAAEYMDPGYIAEYRDGFYVPVESSALYIAQKEARADIRAYAASLGIAWSDVVVAADPENASPYQAEAELVMKAYNAIDAAASEKQVADTRLAAMDVVEIYAAFVVEAEELEAAKTNAEADVRAYAANYGILWAELEGMAEAETLVGWSAQAVLDEYAKIAAAASEKQVADAKLEAMGALDVLYEAVKGDAMTDIAAWLNGYLDEILGTAGDAGSGVAVVRAFTAETTAGDIYAKLAQAFSEDNAKLVLKYYNDALAAIDAATTVSEVTTAVSTFKAQVASVEAAAQNVTDVDLTGVYVLLAILVVAVAVVIVVMILKRRQQPAQQAAVQEAAPVQAQAAPEPVTREVAVTDDDKEQVVIAANVRSFSEAYVDLSQELRELFNKVRAYALGKENAVEVRQSTGVCVKRNGKQIVKLTVRRNAPVALFFLENEMLKDFRRESGSQSKLKVHATELILREEADLAAAYKMVDLSIEQIDKDIAAKKERAKELRRLRRQQKAEQSKKDGAES